MCFPDWEEIGLTSGFVVCSSSTNVGSNCTFTCRAGYQIVGPSSLICLEITSLIADWSDSAPVCQGSCRKSCFVCKIGRFLRQITFQ